MLPKVHSNLFPSLLRNLPNHIPNDAEAWPATKAQCDSKLFLKMIDRAGTRVEAAVIGESKLAVNGGPELLSMEDPICCQWRIQIASNGGCKLLPTEDANSCRRRMQTPVKGGFKMLLSMEDPNCYE